MRVIILFLLFFSCFQSRAQTIKELKGLLKQDTSKTAIINNTLKLSSVYSRKNMDSAFYYAEKAIKMANKFDEKLLTKALFHKGTFLTLKGNYKEGDSLLIANLKRPIDSTTLGSNYMNLSNSYQLQNRFDEAITYNLNAATVFENLKNDTRLAHIYVNNGIISAKSKNYDNAITYFNKANNKTNKNERLKLYIQMNLSTLYIDTNDYEKGLEFLFSAEAIALKNKYKNELATIYTNFCKVYSDSDVLKNSKKAIDYGLQALEIKKEIGNTNVYNVTLNNIGQAYLVQKKYSEAAVYLKDALVNSTGNLRVAVLNNLKTLYTELGNNKLALNYSDELIKHKDSLNASTQQEKVAEIIERYESDKKQEQIDVLNIKNELQQTKLDSQRIQFIGAAITILLIGLLWYFWYKNKQTKQSLEKASIQHKLLQTQLNPHFLFHSLSSIQSFIYQNKKEESINYLASYSKLMRSILESSNQDFITVAEDSKAINEYLNLQKLNLPENVDLEVDIDERILDVKIPPMFVQPFVENALLHGIKTIENGKVYVKYQLEDNGIKVTVNDNGLGLETTKSNNVLHRSMSSDIIKKRIENLKQTHNYSVDIVTEFNTNGTYIILHFPKK